MTPAEIISLITACASLAVTIYTGLFRMAKIEARVELLWSFLLRRGLNEAINSGILYNQSPLQMNIEALFRHREIILQVREWYEKNGKDLSDVQVFEQIEKRFGEDLMQLCITEKVPTGGCI